MLLELKNIQHFPRMSEETEAFVADLFVNGKKLFYVKNEGCGGETNVSKYEKTPNTAFEELFEYAKTQEKRIDDLVDELFFTYLEAKEKINFQKKIDKATLKGIVYSTNGNLNAFYTITWGYPIATMLLSAKGREVLQKKVNELKNKGYYVHNKNI